MGPTRPMPPFQGHSRSRPCLLGRMLGLYLERGVDSGGVVPVDSHDHTGNTTSGGVYHNYMKTHRNEKLTLRVGKPIMQCFFFLTAS